MEEKNWWKNAMQDSSNGCPAYSGCNGVSSNHTSSSECWLSAMAGDQGEPHFWHRGIKEPDCSLQEHTWVGLNPSGRMFCGQMSLGYSFLAKHVTILFTEKRMRPTKKKDGTYSQILWRFKYVLGLFCGPWHWMHWLCARNYEFWSLPEDFGP